MAQEKKSFITRMLEGKEKSEEYARSTLPTNHWQLFWDILKGNFGKIVKINLLMMITFLPIAAVLVIRNLMGHSNGSLYPFGANLGVGYPAVPNLTGVSESLTMQTDLMAFAAISLCSIIAAIGLSGGMYVIRNMVWTEGIFITSDYWHGVKLNYKNALQTALFFTIILFISQYIINLVNMAFAIGELSKAQKIWFNISKIFAIGFIIFSGMMSFWMIALGVNYNHSFFQLFKNSVLMTIGMLPQTVFFIFLALIPYILFLIGGNLFIVIGAVILILFGFSYSLLVWLDFAQWAFDKFINPKIEGAKLGRGIFNKEAETPAAGSAAELEYNRAILAAGKSKLSAKPIKPIDDSLQVYELPQSFTREDLQKLKNSKQNIADDTAAYEEEHKNDLKYVEYNKKFDERERALQDTDNKKKKRKPPKMLGQ